MRRDLDDVLQGWPFDPEPGEILAREIRARDGRSVLQPRMPDALRPSVPVTNAALLGTLVDAGFGWPNDISVHSGHLADSGETFSIRKV